MVFTGRALQVPVDAGQQIQEQACRLARILWDFSAPMQDAIGKDDGASFRQGLFAYGRPVAEFRPFAADAAVRPRSDSKEVIIEGREVLEIQNAAKGRLCQCQVKEAGIQPPLRLMD